MTRGAQCPGKTSEITHLYINIDTVLWTFWSGQQWWYDLFFHPSPPPPLLYCSTYLSILKHSDCITASLSLSLYFSRKPEKTSWCITSLHAEKEAYRPGPFPGSFPVVILLEQRHLKRRDMFMSQILDVMYSQLFFPHLCVGVCQNTLLFSGSMWRSCIMAARNPTSFSLPGAHKNTPDKSQPALCYVLSHVL